MSFINYDNVIVFFPQLKSWETYIFYPLDLPIPINPRIKPSSLCHEYKFITIAIQLSQTIFIKSPFSNYVHKPFVLIFA